MSKQRSASAITAWLAIAFFIAGIEAGAQEQRTVQSPDGTLSVTIELKTLPRPFPPGEPHTDAADSTFV